jgi:hypothetical protein
VARKQFVYLQNRCSFFFSNIFVAVELSDTEGWLYFLPLFAPVNFSVKWVAFSILVTVCGGCEQKVEEIVCLRMKQSQASKDRMVYGPSAVSLHHWGCHLDNFSAAHMVGS